MSDPVTLPVTLDEAKAFLRVTHDAEDGLITTLLTAAITRLEGLTGLTLSATSPAPLRLGVMYLLALAYQNRGETAADLSALEPWIAPYCQVRL